MSQQYSRASPHQQQQQHQQQQYAQPSGAVDWRLVDKELARVPQEFKDPKCYALKHVVEILTADDPRTLVAQVCLLGMRVCVFEAAGRQESGGVLAVAWLWWCLVRFVGLLAGATNHAACSTPTLSTCILPLRSRRFTDTHTPIPPNNSCETRRSAWLAWLTAWCRATTLALQSRYKTTARSCTCLGTQKTR